MQRRHVIAIGLLVAALIVGGIMLAVAQLAGSNTGLDTNTPNGHSAVVSAHPLS